jgi:isopropylmalate/homocitrate/citramalate synthase
VKRINRLGLSKSTVLGIARPKESDIDACLKADLQEIVLFMPISQLMMKILRETPESEIEKMTRAFEYAKSHGLRFNWVSEDGSRAEPTHLMKTFQTAIDYNAECVILGDTVGILQPETTGYLFEKFKAELHWGSKNKTFNSDNRHTGLGIHCHNDLGQATANTVAAVMHGASFPQVCVNGYGERSGNAAFEEVVVNLESIGIQTGIQMDRIMELSKLVENTFLFPLSAHKAIVGMNSFSHESGLHINAIISHPISYEPFNPTLVGQQRRFYLGKFSGSSAIVDALEKKLKLANIVLTPEVIQKILKDVKATHENASKAEMQQIYAQIKSLIQRVQSGITDKQFFDIVRKDAGDLIPEEFIDQKETLLK